LDLTNQFTAYQNKHQPHVNGVMKDFPKNRFIDFMVGWGRWKDKNGFIKNNV